MTIKPNVNNCPLCQQNNLCDVASPQGCWCMLEKVPKALISQVPVETQGKACICQACITKFNLTTENNFTSL